MNKLQWIFYCHSYIFIQEHTFEIVVWKMVVMLFQCVNIFTGVAKDLYGDVIMESCYSRWNLICMLLSTRTSIMVFYQAINASQHYSKPRLFNTSVLNNISRVMFCPSIKFHTDRNCHACLPYHNLNLRTMLIIYVTNIHCDEDPMELVLSCYA